VKDAGLAQKLERIAAERLAEALVPDALRNDFSYSLIYDVSEDSLFVTITARNVNEGDHWAANDDPEKDGVRGFLSLNETDLVLSAEGIAATLNAEFEGEQLELSWEQEGDLFELAWGQFPLFAAAVRGAGIRVGDERLAASLNISVKCPPVGSLTAEDIVSAWRELS
jgi:hypothetical protein